YKTDALAVLKQIPQHQKSPDAQQHTYLVPDTCRKGAEKIVRFLMEQKTLEKGSGVHGYSADLCEILIVDRCGNRNEYNALFSNVCALMLPDDITLGLNTKTHEITVMFNSLVVSGASIAGNKMDELKKLMGFFSWKGYVNNLNIDSAGAVSFTYAGRQVKGLMTTAGRILEIYTYHKVRELGEFDSVESGLVIDWDESGAKSEIDCVITKGFRTLFIECKARPDIEQEFYYKLATLARQFGINATAVLIADTQEKSYYDNAPVNAMQRRRGSMMDVITIWKQEEISDIGHTLKRIINGTYASEN
ncbi:MAG: DUF1887 family CARF protein, partial [Lachnospiraceae bacterium]|nr:DUF1887 family CARF protein [Lachnospiraceae bacterium]